MQCSPSCAGKECGDDGCGGSCGKCGTKENCENGKCSTVSQRGRANGDECFENGQCISGLCLGVSGSDVKYCREPCSIVNMVCPPDTKCFCYGQGANGACMPTVGKSEVGAKCSTASGCSSGICHTDDGSRGGYCTAPCCNGCSEGMKCRVDLSNHGLCVIPDVVSQADSDLGGLVDSGDEASYTSPGGGCALGEHRVLALVPTTQLIILFVSVFAAFVLSRRSR